MVVHRSLTRSLSEETKRSEAKNMSVTERVLRSPLPFFIPSNESIQKKPEESLKYYSSRKFHGQIHLSQ